MLRASVWLCRVSGWLQLDSPRRDARCSVANTLHVIRYKIVHTVDGVGEDRCELNRTSAIPHPVLQTTV